jgi:hypothetical protein
LGTKLIQESIKLRWLKLWAAPALGKGCLYRFVFPGLHIVLLWQGARRFGMAVVVISGSGYCFICLDLDLATVQTPRRIAAQCTTAEIEPKGILLDGSPPSSKSARREAQG